MASNYELWMDILDFSCIPGFPDKYAVQDSWKELFPLFQQHKYHATTHVQAFMQFLWESNIVHEDIILRLFILSLHLEDNLSVRNWYEGFLAKVFLHSSSSSMHSTWIGITVLKNMKERSWSTIYGMKPLEMAKNKKKSIRIPHFNLMTLIIRLLQKWK